MRTAFVALNLPVEHPLEAVDIDTNPAALALYDELVPVLIGVDRQGTHHQLCHYFLDETAVRGFVANMAGAV